MMAQAQQQIAGAIAPAAFPVTGADSGRCDLSVRGLCKAFGKNKEVLRGVSFSVRNREAVAL